MTRCRRAAWFFPLSERVPPSHLEEHNEEKVLIWVLAAVLVLSMAGCAAGAVSSNDKYVGMEPTAAAEAAAAETKDTTSISDLIRVPFGYLLDWLYTFTNSYGLALILFSLIVKLVLLPMSVKSKKSMLKMSRLSPQVKALEAKYGDDKQKYQLAVQQMYKEEGVSMGGGCLWSFIPLLILLPLYNVIREPITYMMHNSRSISEAIVAFLQASGENLGKTRTMPSWPPPVISAIMRTSSAKCSRALWARM